MITPLKQVFLYNISEWDLKLYIKSKDRHIWKDISNRTENTVLLTQN